MDTADSSSAQGPRRGASATLTYTLLGVVAGLLVVVAVVLVLQNSSQSDEIDSLKDDLAALQTPDEDATAADAAEAKKLKALNQSVELLHTCMPEMQSQLNSIEVTGGYASPTDTISSQCSALVYPNTPQGD